MKTRYLIQLLFLSITIPLIAISCSKSDDEPKPEPVPAPLPFFGIEQLRYDVSADAQTIEVRIKTNIKIKDLVDEDCKGWISAVKTGETDDAQTFDVAIKENKSGEKRIGYVAFDALEPGVSLPEDSETPNTIIIYQSAPTP